MNDEKGLVGKDEWWRSGLPDDAWAVIACFLHVVDVLKLRLVCRQLRRIDLYKHVEACKNAFARHEPDDCFVKTALFASMIDSVTVASRLTQRHQEDVLFCEKFVHAADSRFVLMVSCIDVPASLYFLARCTTDHALHMYMLECAVRLGSLRCAERLVGCSNITTEDMAEPGSFGQRRMDTMLRRAVEFHDASIVRWLIARFRLSRTDIRRNFDSIFVYAGKNKRYDVLQWLAVEYKFGRDDVLSNRHWAYLSTAVFRDAGVVMYLRQHYGLLDADIRYC